MAEEILNRKTERILGETFVSEGRCRVENETVLPDYKEPVRQILRVEARARVNGKNVYTRGQNPACEVEGTVSFSVFYRTDSEEENTLFSSYMISEDYSYTFKLPLSEENSAEDLAALLEARAENVSWKLLGPRKLSLRCDVALALNVKQNRDFCYYGTSVPEHVEEDLCTVKATSLFSSHHEELSFSDTISLPKNYQSIGELCCMDADLFTRKITVRDSGVVISGSVDITAAFVSEQGSLFSFYQPVEFEKSIELESCREDLLAQVILSPDYLKATTDLNEDGENKNVHFQIGISADLCLYEIKEMEVAKDVYSTEFELEEMKRDEKYERLLEVLDFSIPLKGELELSDRKFVRAENVRCSSELKNSHLEKDAVVVEGKARIRFLGITEDGSAIPMEYTKDFKGEFPLGAHRIPRDAVELSIEISGQCRGADVDTLPDRCEYRFEFCGNASLICHKIVSAIHEIKIAQPLEKKEKSLVFYYPDSSDTPWQVAKSYKIPQKEVLAQTDPKDGSLPHALIICL